MFINNLYLSPNDLFFFQCIHVYSFIVYVPKQQSRCGVFSLKEKAISLATLVMLLISQSKCLCTQAAVKMWCFLPQRESILLKNAGHAAEITEQVSPHHLPPHLCAVKKLKIYSANQPNDKGLMHSTFLPPNQDLSSTCHQRMTISETNIFSNPVLCVLYMCFYIACMYHFCI